MLPADAYVDVKNPLINQETKTKHSRLHPTPAPTHIRTEALRLKDDI